MDINTLLRNVIASGAASIPVSLVSGQGVGQTAINALGTGLGAGVGSIGNNYTALGGAIGGNVLANVLGTDRNESNIDALGKYGAYATVRNSAISPVLGTYDQTVNQLVQMMPKSKQDEAMAMIENNLGAASDEYAGMMSGVPSMDEGESAEVNAIIQRIIASQPQAVVVT
jgi:hypothetical protein